MPTARLPAVVLCAVLLGLTAAPLADAQPNPTAAALSAAQQQLLGEMDADTVADVLATVEEAKKWKARFDALRKQADQAQKAGNDLAANGAKSDTAARLLVEVPAFLQKRSPAFRRQLKFAEQLQAKVKAAEDAARVAKYDADQALGQDEATFRRGVRDAALAAASRELFKVVDRDLFGQLEQLRHPAQYARTFVEGEVKAKYLNKPYTAADVVFTLTQQDFRKSVFAPDANLALTMEYRTAGVQLKASGLYFKYTPGKLPQPAFDRVKVESAGVDALAGKALKGLGDELPDFGLPVKITDPKFTGFDAPDAAKRGTLSFGVHVGLDDSLGFGSADLVKATASVVVSTKGKVEVSGLGGTIKGTVPIGTTGTILDGGTILIKPKDKKETVTIGTWIAPAAAGKDSLSLEVKLAFGFPVTKTGIAYKGTLVVGRGTPARQVLGTVDGVISKEKVTGHFVAAAGLAYKLDAKFELNREALTAQGTFEALFGVRKMAADLYVGFNGYGRFTASEKFELAKAVKAEASLTGSYAPGFKKLRLEGALALDVECQPLGTFGAVVQLVATTDPKPVVKGTGTVGDVTVQFEAADFGGVYDALRNAMLKKRDELYRYLADREKAARKYAAEREKVFDNWVYQNAKAVGLDKLSIDKGGPIDSALGRTSQELKNAGGTLSDGTKQLGKEAHDLWQKTQDVGSSTLSTVTGGLFRGMNLTDPPAGAQARGWPPRVGKVGGANAGFELAGLDVDHALKDPVKQVDKAVQEAAARARVTARLSKVTTALERERIHKARHGRTGEAAELLVRLDRAVAHPEGADAVITFAVQVNSFKHTLDPKKPAAKPVTASDLGIGEVRVRGAFGSGPSKAEVHLPKLRNVSGWDADALIRDAVTEIVQKNLGADGAGRFEERLLAVHNATDEPIRVWVQVERQQKGAWAWLPDGRGADHRSYQYTIPARKTFTLNTSAGSPVAGRAARLWAESESGRVWVKHLRTNEVLVDEKDESGAARYYADKMEHFVYTFSASAGQRTFRERVVAVRNTSGVPVVVHATALSRDPDGKEAWDKTADAGVRVEPGAAVKLRQANGWLLRGTDAKVWAEAAAGPTKWTKHRAAAVKQVGPRGYTGTGLGSFLYVLEPAGRAGGPGGSDAAELHLQPDPTQPSKPEPPKPPTPPKPTPPKPPVNPPPKPNPPVVPPAAPVAVPNVHGLTLDAARKKVEDAGLVFAVVVGKETIPPARYETYRGGWHVTSQTPAADRPPAKKGTTVVCVFVRDPARPPVRRDVPNP